MSDKIILERKYFYTNLINHNKYNCYVNIYYKLIKYFNWTDSTILNIKIGDDVVKSCRLYYAGGKSKSLYISISIKTLKKYNINDNDLLKVELLEDNCTIEISKIKDIPDKLELILKMNKTGNSNYGFVVPKDIIDAYKITPNTIIEITDINNKYGYKCKLRLNKKFSYILSIRIKLRSHLELTVGDYVKLSILNNTFVIEKGEA